MLVVGAEVGGITTPTAKGPLTNSSVRIRPRISGSRCSLIWGPIKKPARVHCILEVSYAPRLGCHVQGWLLLAYPLRGRIRGRLSRCAGHDSVAILVQGLSSFWALLPSALYKSQMWDFRDSAHDYNFVGDHCDWPPGYSFEDESYGVAGQAGFHEEVDILAMLMRVCSDAVDTIGRAIGRRSPCGGRSHTCCTSTRPRAHSSIISETMVLSGLLP